MLSLTERPRPSKDHPFTEQSSASITIHSKKMKYISSNLKLYPFQKRKKRKIRALQRMYRPKINIPLKNATLLNYPLMNYHLKRTTILPKKATLSQKKSFLSKNKRKKECPFYKKHVLSKKNMSFQKKYFPSKKSLSFPKTFILSDTQSS